MEDFNVILPSERFSFTGNSQENKIGLSSQSEPMDWLHKIMHSEPYNKEFNPKYITYIRIILLWRLALSFPPKVFLLSPEYLKADTHKRFCSWSKAPPCVPTLSSAYFILGSRISTPQNVTLFRKRGIKVNNKKNVFSSVLNKNVLKHC